MALKITYTGSNPRKASSGKPFTLPFRIDAIPGGAMTLTFTIQTAGVTFNGGGVSTFIPVVGRGSFNYTASLVLHSPNNKMVSLLATLTIGAEKASTNVNVDLVVGMGQLSV